MLNLTWIIGTLGSSEWFNVRPLQRNDIAAIPQSLLTQHFYEKGQEIFSKQIIDRNKQKLKFCSEQDKKIALNFVKLVNLATKRPCFEMKQVWLRPI